MPGRVPSFRRKGVPNLQPKRSADDAEWRRFIGGAPWKKCRASFVAKVPHCEFCLAFHDRLVPVGHVHHEKGHDMEHALDHTYLWGLCKSCHSQVTLAERRGQVVEYPAARPVQVEEHDGHYC
jgi:hypothetical protein